jgi:hypothetical protein
MRFERKVIPEDQLLREINTKSYTVKRQYDERMESFRRSEEDADKTKRLGKRECKWCFYIYSSRMGGAAMTTAPCEGCGNDMGFSSTCTDRFCKDCSVKYDLCKHCGGDIDMRTRRRRLTYD